VDSPVQNSRFQMQEGKLVEIYPGKAGNAVDIETTAKEIEKYLIAPENPVKIEIAVISKEPKVTQKTIDKYGIKELVGLATTNFEGGSLDRQHNIETGVSKLNGILIAPGEEFSAVKAIGDITEEAGFVKEYVIKANTTEKELGGGLCQIATTLFRTVLNAGLPVTERQNHRYVISYYGAGLDATIYGPHPDLRFVNDTGNYLLLQGKAENNEVILEFYGKKDGRIVEIADPVLTNRVPAPAPRIIVSNSLPLGQIKCSEIPHSGVTADTKYTVTYFNGQVQETIFHSVYQPWQKTCLVGSFKN
jgi:vancomycin resistance protein YoaR